MAKVVFNFEKLTVYQKALDFIDTADAMIDTFPKKGNVSIVKSVWKSSSFYSIKYK